MSNIKRYSEDGQIYFVTAVTCNRKPIFKDRDNANFLLITMEYLKYFLYYFIYGYCIMPDHFHLLIMPSEKHNISKIMQYIKGNFARRYNQHCNDCRSPLNKNNDRDVSENNSRRGLSLAYNGQNRYTEKHSQKEHENKVWQQSFYDEVIRNEKDFNNKLIYMHNNPVKAELVVIAKDYKFSSYYQYYGKERESVQMSISKLEL